LSGVPAAPYDHRMKDRNGTKRDVWVMVDHDGQRTLFQLIEVGQGDEVMRLARDLHAPAVVVDMALPAFPALDDVSGHQDQSARSRLILLNVRTAAGGSEDGIVFRPAAQPEALAAGRMGQRGMRPVRSVRDRPDAI